MKKFWISFIALLMGVVIGVGIWHGIAYKDKLESFAKESWDKIKSVFVKKDNNQPTEEQISLDGLYYTFDLDGYIHFFRFKDNQFGNIERGGARGLDDKTITEIYLPSDWETQELTESYHTTEDAEYIRAYCKNPDSQDFVFAIYDKATKKLYYDFSNGEQLPGKTYEEQMLIEMVKFDKFVIHDHVHGRRSVFKEPTCTESGVVFIYCEDCRDMCDIEYPSSLGHDYVDGVCTRCQEHDPNYVEACEHDWVEDLSYVPTAPSCGEYWDTQYKCSKCNETKLEKNGPLPHDWVDGVCSRCGTQCQHVHENGHICPICGCEVEKKLTWRVGKPATCTENGVEYGDCICGYNSEMREIPATGHTFDAGICTSCNALDEEFYNNFVGYWFTETTGFDVEGFSKYYFLIEKDGDNYYFTRSGYKVKDGKIILYNNSTDYGSRQSFTFTASNYLGSTPLIAGFTLTRQETTFNGCYDGSQLSVGDMIFIKTDKEIYLDGSSAPVTPM